MGIVLRKGFKGKHLWIPPIPQQIDLMKKQGYSDADINHLGIDF